MTAVLVHGNPETSEVWDLLVDQLVAGGSAKPVCLSPPGFGAPVPDGFSHTPDAYRDWLIDALSALQGPIDLVGHDWGGLHVAAAITSRPGLVRSWASDALGVLAPDYEWHSLAQVWQTAGEGEAWISDHLALTTYDRAAVYRSLGVDGRIAAPLAARFDDEMGSAILALYRAAVPPTMQRVGRALAAAAAVPGLAIIAERDDTVGTDRQRGSMAALAGAAEGRLDAGHWWMTEQDGRAGALLLQQFWMSLP